LSLLPSNALTKKLSSPTLFFYALFWLMTLLVVGTITQKYIGLYQAQEKFFSSWFLWHWSMPVAPGGRMTMAFIILILTCKLLFSSPWRTKNVGVMVTHFGSLMLLGGGVLTAYFSSEGSMVLDEGQSSGVYQDYHAHEIAVVDTRGEAEDEVIGFSGSYLKQGATLKTENLPFKMEVLSFYENIYIAAKKNPALESERGMAKRFDLKEMPLSPEENQNRAGIRLKVSGLGDGNDGIYALYEYMDVPQSFTVGKDVFQIALRKKAYILPFEIELLDFERQVHPGTNTPRSFKSDVNVVRGEAKRKLTISMNEPLRTEGYTLYQSSFSQAEGKETSILAVVENKGRMFPYIASIIICIGILIHLVLHIPQLIRRA
jgi:hypothetical protein